MTLSIRARLLLGTTAALAVLMILSALVIYHVLHQSLKTAFDKTLLTSARTLSGAVELDMEGTRLELQESEAPEYFRKARPDYFQILRENGDILERSPSLQSDNLARFAGPVGAPIFRKIRLPDGRAGRAVGLRFHPKVDEEVKDPGPPEHITLVVARETSDLDSTIRFIRSLLAAVTGVTVILALISGAFVIRQGLKPLETMASHIAALREDRLLEPIGTEGMPSEVVPVVHTLNTLLARLDEAFRRERTLTADVAHELRTPLAGIRSTIEVALSRQRPGEDYRRALSDCLDILGHLQRMMDHILALARLENEQTALHPERLRFGPLIENAWEPLADKARNRALIFEREFPEECACLADRETTLMILTNILTNAVEHADAGGRIAISALRSGGDAVLTITNSGCALSQEAARHVFDRFWRGEASREGTGGHYGLGLALVQRAVIMLGGTISATVDRGTFTIHLRLPSAP